MDAVMSLFLMPLGSDSEVEWHQEPGTEAGQDSWSRDDEATEQRAFASAVCRKGKPRWPVDRKETWFRYKHGVAEGNFGGSLGQTECSWRGSGTVSS